MSKTDIESEALLDEKAIPTASHKAKTQKLWSVWMVQGVLFLLNLTILMYQKTILYCEPTYGDISKCGQFPSHKLVPNTNKTSTRSVSNSLGRKILLRRRWRVYRNAIHREANK